MTDILIFKKIKEGDIQAFESLFRSYYEPLCRYSYQLIKDIETAKEIVQELFYIIWKERKSLAIFTSVNGYLYRSVKNKSIQYLQKVKIREDYRDLNSGYTDIETYTPQEELEYNELERHLQETLFLLPERRRKIFQLNRMEGKKYNEIAQELNISVKTVEAEISKALGELRIKYNSIYESNRNKKTPTNGEKSRRFIPH